MIRRAAAARVAAIGRTTASPYWLYWAPLVRSPGKRGRKAMDPIMWMLLLSLFAWSPSEAPAQLPPRDAPPPHVQAGKAEAALRAEIEAEGWTVDRGLALARLQEQRKAADEAEATLVTLRKAFQADQRVREALLAFYVRQGRGSRVVALLEEAAAADPKDKEAQYRLAVHSEEFVRRDATLSPEQRREHAVKGLVAARRALEIDPGYAEAMVYQNILLRHQASAEPDEGRRQALVAEADALRTQAMALMKERQAEKADAQPQPPPAPGCDIKEPVNGRTPVRVGGEVKAPARTRFVEPVFSPDAHDGKAQRVVILDVAIAEDGLVANACVLRSVPLLDQAALDAVRQWEFEPPLVDGAPHPILMTVTVNFMKADGGGAGGR
jgi:TonB family protein